MARPTWLQCMRDTLSSRGFGNVRLDDIEQRVQNRAASYRANGEPQPEARAVADEMAAISLRSRETARGAVVEMERAADTRERITENAANSAALKSPISGGKPSYNPIAMSYVEHQPGIAETSGGNLREMEQNYLERIRQKAAAVYLESGKGFLGKQRAQAHGPNIVREVIDGFGTTGDALAERVARSFVEASDHGVDLFNAAGGAMQKLDRYFPQRMSAAALYGGAKTPAEELARRVSFVTNAMKEWDWARMTHPDETPILPSERETYASDVYTTILHDGANKLEASGGGRGVNTGNMLDSHRQIFFQNADAWLRWHELYGDGHIFDIMNRHLGQQARNAALVHVFGRNPAMAQKRIAAQMMRAASEADPNGLLPQRTEAAMNSFGQFNAAMDTVLNTQPLNEFAKIGTMTATTGALLRSSLLGSVALTSLPGDAAQRTYRRMFTGQRLMGGFSEYLKSMKQLAGSREAQEQGAQIGVFHDDLCAGLAEHRSRFDPMQASLHGGVSKAAGFVWRASGMQMLDVTTRRVVRNEMMGFFHRSRDTAFDNMPAEWKRLFADYQIDAGMWDAFRKNTPVTSAGRAKWFAPIRILETQHPDREAIYNRFNSLMQQEAYAQFMDRPQIEIQAISRPFTRPTSFWGMLASSPMMLKSFPLSFALSQGRIAMRMSPNSMMGRLGYLGGMAAALGLAGAVTTQAYHLANGTDVEAPSTPGEWASFWGRSVLRGGGLGFYGDALQSVTQDQGSKLAEATAGPLIASIAKTGYAGYVWSQAGLAAAGLSSTYTKHGKQDATFGDAAKATLALRQYFVPGNNLWYGRLALQRELWDRLSMAIDPHAYQTMRTQVKNAQRGQAPFWWEPGGDFSDARAPNLNPLRTP